MKIKIGQIIKAYHYDDLGKRNLHPFLIVNITKKNIYGVQCSSVKVDDNESYFSRNNINYYELEYSDTEYITHVNLESFDFIDHDEINSILCEPNWNDYNRIAQELLLIEWENNEYMNNNTIHDHVWKGIEQFNKEWIIN